jgi:glycerol-3-phosphate acyltransferase PlsY
VAVFTVVLAASRYVSLGSISAAAVLPFAAWATHASAPVIGITALLSALAIFKHRANIQRLLAGTENRIGSSARKEAR